MNFLVKKNEIIIENQDYNIFKFFYEEFVKYFSSDTLRVTIINSATYLYVGFKQNFLS